MSDTETEHRIPGWLIIVLFFVAIAILGSISNSTNNEPYVGVCNRPTVQQTC